MRVLILVSALLSLGSLSGGAEKIVLFDGQSLEGWDSVGSAKWRVENGAIVGGQDGDPRKSGILMTKRLFKDFELELEFKIDEHGKYNSGVYLRKPRDRKTGRAYQVNIGRGAAGESVGLYLNDWLAKGDEHDKIRIPLKWNELRILIFDNRIQVWLNKKQIVDYTDENPEKYLLEPGFIAFQTYGAEEHSGWVKFRNIRLKDLSKE